jgi:hypothetical protein
MTIGESGNDNEGRRAMTIGEAGNDNEGRRVEICFDLVGGG